MRLHVELSCIRVLRDLMPVTYDEFHDRGVPMLALEIDICLDGGDAEQTGLLIQFKNPPVRMIFH